MDIFPLESIIELKKPSWRNSGCVFIPISDKSLEVSKTVLNSPGLLIISSDSDPNSMKLDK